MKEERWLFLRTDGEIEKIVNEKPTLAEMQEWVGGLIEYTGAEEDSNFFVNCVKSSERARRIGDGQPMRHLRVIKQNVLDIVVNEEGLLMGLRPNMLATLAKHKKSLMDLERENITPLVGNAIIHYEFTGEPHEGERRYTVAEASQIITGVHTGGFPVYGGM